MIRKLALALALSLSPANLPATAQEADRAKPAELTAEEAALARDRYERMTVPVSIDGSKPYRFLVDTGAQATAVTYRIVNDLELTLRGKATLVAMGSVERVDLVEVDELSFADRSITGLMSPLLKASNVGADGILGLDSLQDLRVLIDFREERMLVADAKDLGGNSGYEIIVRARRKLGQMVITNAYVNGVRTAVVIDTGAQNSIGNRSLLRKLRAREMGQMTSVDVNGSVITSDLSFARELEIGGLTLGNVPIGFTDSPVFDALGLAKRPAIILGIGNMRVFDRVAIDFAKRQVLFDIPGKVDPARARAMFRNNWISTP